MNVLTDLQRAELDILRTFGAVAEREGLRWFVMFGTLLGAVRRKGFIPWDDDIDVAMPREDYDRLRTSEGWFNPPYFLQTPENDPAAAPRFIRLRNSETAVMTNFPNGMTKGGNMGAYIDILPLDDVPNGTEARDMNRAARRIQKQMLASAALDESGDEAPAWKELICYKYGGVPGMYPMLARRYEKFCARYSGESYCFIPVISKERGGRVYDKLWFSSAADMVFEGLTVPAPAGWKEVLIVSYPEGLNEPAERFRRAGHTENCIVDTRRSYREYASRHTDMLAGIENKKVFIFGAGDSLRIWLERYGRGLNVYCALDNARAKWGKTSYGVPVRAPSELPGLMDGDSRLIIASIYRNEISKQLESMDIKDYYYFVDGLKY